MISTSQSQTGQSIGVDICKRYLDAAGTEEKPFRVTNDTSGRQTMVERLKALGVSCVVLEATGGLERPVLAALLAAGLPASIVNPARVRAFAEGTGKLAKTDKIDAKVLAAYGAYMRPAVSVLPSSARAKLKELLSYRGQIGEEVTARSAQLQLYASADLKARASAALETLKAERRAIERQIEALIASEEELAAPFQILTSVPSVGTIVGATLIADLPELGRLCRRRIAALVGLAPFPRDSGDRRGHRAIRGGRSQVRKALFNAARVAIQHNPKIKAFYQRLRQNGKPGKVAIVAAMHKLLTILNAMLKSRQTWQASRP
jgi:transposase